MQIPIKSQNAGMFEKTLRFYKLQYTVLKPGEGEDNNTYIRYKVDLLDDAELAFAIGFDYGVGISTKIANDAMTDIKNILRL